MLPQHKRALIALAGLFAIGLSLYFNFSQPFSLISWVFLLLAGGLLFWMGRIGKQ